MNKKYALYILIGFVIGAVFGTALSPAIENTALATALGAVSGIFIGWFMAAIDREHGTSNENTQGKKITKKEIFALVMIISIAILVSSMIIFQPEWLF